MDKRAAFATAEADESSDTDAESETDDGYITISVDLWGVSIFMSHQLVTDLKSGTGGVAKIQKLLADAIKGVQLASQVLTALGGPAGSIAAAVLELKAVEFSLADRGNGVWVPITWLQLPTLVLPAMAAAWIHPLPAEWTPPRIL